MSMQVIEHIEVTAATQAELVIDNIPQTYTDLVLVTSIRCNRAGDPNVFQDFEINGSTANITSRALYFYNVTVTSGSLGSAIGVINTAGSTSNTFTSSVYTFPNYSATDQYKSFSVDSMSENNGVGGGGIWAGLYSSNTAISSITLSRADASLVQYSSATLYGITSGSDGVTSVS